MTLTSGTKLGPYEIQSPAGAGGMGEVYRAHDTRLGRDVAVKVMPASFAADVDRLRRFEQEARTVAALNHPNILGLFDIGTHEGAPYIVSELLEGQTIRERLKDGAIAPRKAVELLVQIAEGLAAAHEKGVVHRDLKPENVFITRDGRVKILDFGLAKLRPQNGKGERAAAAGGPGDTLTSAGATPTTPGMVLGTVGYMSPEQVRGKEVDARSDIFSFGAVAYEMISGKQAFRGDSSVETMNAILKEEPPELDTDKLHVSPGLERIIRHCLEKDPGHRFQSARDLAFDLAALSHLSGSSAEKAMMRGGLAWHPRQWMITAAVAIVVAMVAGTAAMRFRHEERLEFQQLTFRRGTVFSARFAADKKTVLYSAQWGGDSDEVFSTVADSRESRPLGLGLGNAELLAASSTGELAVLLKPDVQMAGFVRVGTLARVALASGTAPREVAEQVAWADWSPDGSQLAVARVRDGEWVIEYPLGKVIYKQPTQGWIGHMRVSPKGDAIAFLAHEANGDDAGKVTIIATDGKVRASSEYFPGVQGLAWAPDNEVWFTAVPQQGVASRQLLALSTTGRRRVLLIAPGEMTLHDIDSDGMALVTVNSRTRSIIAIVDGKERNLDWLDRPVFSALSADGKLVLFHEGGKAGGPTGTTYLRGVDGSPAVRLSEGYSMALSNDGKWVLGTISNPLQFRVIPTGAGEPKTVDLGPSKLQNGQIVGFSADSKHLLINGTNPEGKRQTMETDFDGGNPRAHTPPGSFVLGVARSGCCEVRQTADGLQLFNLATGAVEPFSPLRPNEGVVGGSADVGTLYLAERDGKQVKLWRLDRRTGARTFLTEILPHDATGVMGVNNIRVSADGKTIVYGYTREVSDLYLARPTK
ncbi:MAG TPA: protein kinase [Terriglobales bacterium]|nr:protein kinase [Terriglobales bacterium]